MIHRRTAVCVLAGAVLAGLAWGGPLPAAGGDKQEPKKEPAKRGGTVVGFLTGKGDNHVEVRADGEEKARRYVPRWVGGAPAQGGGPDKQMLKTFRGLKVGSRVRLEWEFDERPRVIRMEVIRTAEKGQ